MFRYFTACDVTVLLSCHVHIICISLFSSCHILGAAAVVYVFSTVDRESFLEVERWRSKVENECGHICSVLVQNKIDLLAQASVTKEEAEDLARRMNIKLYRTCVKDNLLVDDGMIDFIHNHSNALTFSVVDSQENR